MGLFSFIGDIFKPAAKLVDDLNTSTEEKLILKNELASIQAQANEKLLELEMAALNARKEIAIAEANSSNWLTASWRPISSMVLISVMGLAAFGIADVTPEFIDFAKVFTVGYAGGRSLEKVAKITKLGK